MAQPTNWNVCDNASHFSRRTLFGAGLGVGTSSLLTSLAQRLAYADQQRITDPARPKNVILLWLAGGPSQLETFDPHAGTSIGGEVTAIDTSLRGLKIADTLPRVAEQMHLTSLIRSVTGKEGDHQRAVYNIRSGYRPDPTLKHPSIGAVLCHADPRGGDLPRHISILPGNEAGRGGYLGAKFDAFKIDDPSRRVPDVRASVDDERFQQRLDHLRFVEEDFRRNRLHGLESNRTLHRTATDAALKMMSSEQLDAFDVSGEPQSDQDAFGDSAFGRGCLAATRLIEVGTRCVEVTLSGWDSHITNHSLQSSACEILDPALAALLDRLEQRDLLDSTLVVCGGEFGRTPRINPAEGRDHWPHGFSTLLAGCGIRRGAVYGSTSPEPKLQRDDPMQDIEKPVTIADVHSTILRALGIDHDEELDTPVGRPIKRSEGKPIEQLLA